MAKFAMNDIVLATWTDGIIKKGKVIAVLPALDELGGAVRYHVQFGVHVIYKTDWFRGNDLQPHDAVQRLADLA